MAGNLREKRPGVWEVRVFVGRDAMGKVRHVSRTVRGTKRTAQRERARLAMELDARGSDVVEGGPSRIRWDESATINDAIRGWMDNGWEDLSPSTTRRYASLVRVHIEDSIGVRRIADLGPHDVEQFLRQLKRKGLGESSVKQVRAVLHRACRLARKWSNNRLANPVADTELPDWSSDDQSESVRAPSHRTPDSPPAAVAVVTIPVNLREDLAARLAAEAARRGLTVDEALADLVGLLPAENPSEGP